MGAADPAKDLTMDRPRRQIEPPHSSSPTDHVLSELQLFGYRPFDDQPDPRPLPEGDDDRWRSRRHLRRPGRHAERHPARTGPRGPALVDRQPLPPCRRPHRTPARRQRAGATQEPARAERLGGAIGRTRAPDGRGHHADRTPQLPRTLPRSGHRTLRGPHRFVLAPPLGIAGQPPHADRGNDRLPGFHRRQAPRRDRGHVAGRTEDRAHRRPRLQRPPPDLGPPRQGPRQASRHGPASMAARQRAPS